MLANVFVLIAMVIRRVLPYTPLFADALRIGEKKGNESTI
jgi:hypothetical protein